MKGRRVILVNTAAPDRPNGSMVRYGAMVREALERHGGGVYEIEQLDLAPTEAWLDRFPGFLRTPIRYLCIAIRAHRRLPSCHAALLHLLDGSHAYLLGAARSQAAPLAVTLHDMIPALRLRGELGTTRPGRAGGWLIRQTTAHLSRADVLVADSFHTRDDLIRLAGVERNRVHVVPPAVSLPDPISPGGLLRPPTRYILHVAGNNTFYKNRQGVVDIFKIIHRSESIKLKMAGAPPDAALRRKVQSSGVPSAIEFLPNVSESELSDLYRGAALLLFPSLYEGFGWPPLEAMAHGCPVVCTNVASLSEVAGEAALTAPPAELDTLANHVLRLLRDPALRQRLVEAGFRQARRFSLEAFARGLIAAYDAAEGAFQSPGNRGD